MGLLSNLFGKKDQSCCNVTIEEVKKEADSCCGDKKPNTIQTQKEEGNSCCQ